ncbi:DoxX family protein [Pantoea sp. M_9]|uniref:DoxX family protein n=1 Tax=Pantoea sp. M_9 TaxID=2608041 RepID=UPI00123214D6|nr:DoxX family protein [Pantoea sp. M_9]KAA5971607.1 DoxX family protein [Pantoea sp. M_9]
MNVMKLLLSASGEKCSLPLTVARIAVGLFFFASGFNKVFVPANQQLMLDTLTDAGIFFPGFMAPFVAACEMVFGLLLAMGFMTRLSSGVLMIISLVALCTVGIHQIPENLNLLTWYSWLLYLPESGYILMCLFLLVQGGGPVAVDRVIARRLWLR